MRAAQAAFNGINRKVQLKPLRWGVAPVPPQPADGPAGAAPAADEPQHSALREPFLSGGSHGAPLLGSMSSVGHAGGGFGQASSGGGGPPLLASHGSVTATAPGQPQLVLEEALLILKWGGVLTHAGRQQAEDLGR